MSVPSEVWFPSLMTIVGLLAAGGLGIVASALQYRRERRHKRADQERQEIVELMGILTTFVIDHESAIREARKRERDLTDSRAVGMDFGKQMARAWLLTALIRDDELRHLSNVAVKGADGFIGLTLDEEGWEEAAQLYTAGVDDFNDRARIVLSK